MIIDWLAFIVACIRASKYMTVLQKSIDDSRTAIRLYLCLVILLHRSFLPRSQGRLGSAREIKWLPPITPHYSLSEASGPTQ